MLILFRVFIIFLSFSDYLSQLVSFGIGIDRMFASACLYCTNGQAKSLFFISKQVLLSLLCLNTSE